MTSGPASGVVRDARPEDAAACAAIHVRSWQEAYRGMLPDDYLDGLRPADRLDAWTRTLNRPTTGGCLLVVETADGVGGFLRVVPHESLGPDWAELPMIYLDPPAIGHGHGRALMTEGLRRLDRLGYTQVELWVHPLNLRAQRFYEAGGWQSDGTERTETVWGIEVPELRYSRTIGS